MGESGEKEALSGFKPNIIGYHDAPAILNLFEACWEGIPRGEFKQVGSRQELVEEVRTNPHKYDIVLIQLGDNKVGLKTAAEVRSSAPEAIIAIMTGGEVDRELELKRQEFDIDTILQMPIKPSGIIDFYKDAQKLTAKRRARNN